MSLNFAIDARRRGFSLIELAIVLGVIGIVLGTLWGVVTIVRENMKRGEAQTQIAMVVRNVRDYYLGRASITDASGKTGERKSLTSYLIEKRVLLPEQIRARAGVAQGGFLADHPWGPAAADGTALSDGGFGVCSTGGGCMATNIVSQFDVQLQGLKKSSCVALATQVSGPSGPAGLISVHINGGGALSSPVTVESAHTGCAKVSNKVDFVYRLRVLE